MAKSKNKVGGWRPGGGRPKSLRNQLAEQALREASETGLLPHQWLLQVMRGDPMTQHVLIIHRYVQGAKKGEEKSREWIPVEYRPTFEERMMAAKICAPFFAPKLAAHVIKPADGDKSLVETFAEIIKGNVPKTDDDDETSEAIH